MAPSREEFVRDIKGTNHKRLINSGVLKLRISPVHQKTTSNMEAKQHASE